MPDGNKKYSAGTLDLSILGYSDNAVASITKTVRALNSLSKAVTNMQGLNYGAQAQKLTRFFEKLSTSTNAINAEKLKVLADVGRSFSNISSISKLEKVDYAKVAAGFYKLTIAITPFIDKAREAEASLTALHGILSKSSGKKIQSLLVGGGADGAKGGLFRFAKMGSTVYLVRRLSRYAANIVKAGSDYLETMNLWQVAMRENLDLADEFVNKMNKAYGVSTKTTMQAQATFKNMIGSLGDLSDETAYRLSEAITQMAFDYSSLYNVKLEQAVEKFQSALAGQVRPIRSISGYDITEKTIHALYQSLGGTKTQRQLSRTEKQLLAILAVYKQMGASGALGDMAKTIDQFANQSRMMVEYWTELKSWSGLILKDLVDQSGLMVYINAFLITFTEVVKAIAKSKGLGDDNFVNGIFESAESANDEIDELQGKLLEFDKFRSLSGQETGADVAIDQQLLNALAGYTSYADQVVSKAQELAAVWREWWFDDDDTLTVKAQILLGVLKAIGVVLAVLIGASMIASIAKLVTLLGTMNATTAALVIGFGTLVWGITTFIAAWNDMSGMKRAVSIILALAAAAAALYVAVSYLRLDFVSAIGMAALAAGSALAIMSSVKIPNFENGASDIDSGTVFRAGEFGKTEAVYTGSNGKTNVANVKQMEQAFYNALSRYGAEDGGKIVVEAYLDGEKVYQNTTAKAKQRGKVWANA
jgi:hypothetical protein